MAVSGNTPASLDLNVRQGSDLALTVAVQLDAVDYDFTGATVTAKVLDGSGREQTSVTWATTTATGELVLALSAAETALIRSGWRWYVDVTKASLTQPWLAGALIPVAPGFAGPTSTTVSLSLATGDGHALSISADPGQGLAAHEAAADPHTGYVLESVLTTAGDLLTRGASAPDRVTRASLAQDTAFSSRYAPRPAADGSVGQVLRIASTGPVVTEWASGSGGGASALDDLSDVAITAAASGDILRHNGTAWVDTPGTTHFEAAGAVASHEADTTNVHGIADTSVLLTTTAAPELIRDTIGTALVAGTNVTITVSDPGDTITIAASGGGASDPLDGNNIIAARVFAR